MKTKPCHWFTALALLALSTLIYQPSTLHAQGTAFTYQGRLYDGTNAANGNYDMLFSLYDAASGGNQVDGTLMGTAVPVTNGLFTVTLDFGNQFPGADRWLKLDVRTNGVGPYTPLSPRQALTATPYAITAGNLTGNLPASQLSGTLTPGQLPGAVVTNGSFGVTLTGTFTGNGANVSNVNAVTLGGLGAANFWQTTGNAGTTAGANFLGTVDNQPLEIKVNNLRAMRYEPAGVSSNALSNGYSVPNGAPNVIGGSPINFVTPGVVGAVIAGGGATNYFGFADTNSIASDFGVIGGGNGNQIQTNAVYSTIGGGDYNQIQAYVFESTIGGGGDNLLQIHADDSTIGGGGGNLIQAYAYEATIGGGGDNTIQTNAYDSTIGGGNGNQVSGIGSFIGGGGFDGVNYSGNVIQGNASVIGGGDGNQVSGIGSFIGGGGFDGYEVAGNNNAGNAAVIGGGLGNTIQANASYATIGGGFYNLILGNAFGSTIGGGWWNQIQANASFATIGGGVNNLIQTNASWSTIGGGGGNQIQTNASFATIGGGVVNQIQANANWSTIGGGSNNLIQANAVGSTIAGGNHSIAGGAYSFAAGNRAQATNSGAFVWSDDSGTTTTSFTNNQFMARASGGVVFLTSAAASPTSYATGSAGVALSAGATSWSTVSDRNVKKNFEPVNGESILDKLARVPVAQWNYKWEKDSDVPNIGPMAQDFKHAFYPGRDDKSITTLEFDGVELAAIQGLNQKLNEKDAEIQDLKTRLEKLEQLMNEKNGEAK